MSAGGGAKAIIAAFVANLGIAIAKFVGFVITGSASMLAESIHSAADAGNQGLLLLGRKRATRAPDADHPFGYGRERFFWAFVVALVLFSLGSLFALFEGYSKIAHPHSVDSPLVAIGILAFAIVLESFSMHTAIVEARPHLGRDGWLAFIRRTKEPELPVVLLEDLGALIGLVVAFVALVLTWQVHPIFDGIGTMIIGVLLGVIAIVLAIEMKSLLIGEGASIDDVASIRAAIEGDVAVAQLIHLRTQHIGADEILVAAKLGLQPDLDLAAIASAIDRVEATIRAAVPTARLVYLEPDLYRVSLAVE